MSGLPGSGQRLVEITQTSNGTVATVTAQWADSIAVTFTPGAHRSVFSRAWLAANGGSGPDFRTLAVLRRNR